MNVKSKVVCSFLVGIVILLTWSPNAGQDEHSREKEATTTNVT